MRAGLNDLYRPVDRLEPLGKAVCKQLAKRRTNTHAGDEVALAADLASLFFVITELRMIQRQLHKPRERHRTVVVNFSTDHPGEWVRSLRHGAHSD